MEKDIRRMFIGLKINAPWPAIWPHGRFIENEHQHLTLAFLGATSYSAIINALKMISPPSFLIGPCGRFDSLLLLPKKTPRVVAYHATWFNEALVSYQKTLANELRNKGFSIEEREWLSHVSLCRKPFNGEEWTRFFQTLPCYCGDLHLYESLGNLHYRSLWSHSLLLPFEEIEHTADIAFHVYGKDLKELYESAYTALAFRCPELSAIWEATPHISSLDDIIILLNAAISRMDRLMGCPFKAVSFHGKIEACTNGLLKWEMIVDV